MRKAWLMIQWHRLRGHRIRDLGHPLGQHRVWCYSCAEDLLPWDQEGTP